MSTVQSLVPDERSVITQHPFYSGGGEEYCIENRLEFAQYLKSPFPISLLRSDIGKGISVQNVGREVMVVLDFSLATSFCTTPLRGSQWGACVFYGYRLIFSVTVNKKVIFFCFKELDINKPVFFVSSKQNEGLTDHFGIK